MKKRLVCGMTWILVGLVQWGQADTIYWKADYLKLGKVDAGTGGWGVERVIGETRGSGEFVMPVELVYRNTEEGTGLFGVQWRSPQLESRLIPKSEEVLEWWTPWGSVVGLVRAEKVNRYQDVRREWQAVEIAKYRFNLTRKDGWKFEYDNGLLKQATSPNGRKLICQYKDKKLSKMAQKTEGAGDEWTLVEIRTDADTGCVTWLKAGGVEYEFEYHQAKKDGQAQLTSWKQGQGKPECFEYNRQGVLTGITSPGGKRETLEVEVLPDKRKPKSDQKAEEEPSVKDFALMKDGQYEYTYSGEGSVSAKDALGRTQSVNFSGLRGILTLTDNAGRTSRVKFYRQLGLRYDMKVRQVKNAEGRVVLENKYDADGHLIWSRDELGNVTEWEIGPNGKAVKMSRRAGKRGEPETIATYDYDERGNLVRVRDALNQVTEFRYNAAGDVVNVKDAESREWTFQYDRRGLLVSSRDPAGRAVKMDYDTWGRPLKVTSPSGVTVGWMWDEQGRWKELTRLLPGESKNKVIKLLTREYNEAGKLAKITDSLGQSTVYEYDNEERLKRTSNPLTVAMCYTYDEVNRLTDFRMEGEGKQQGKVGFAYNAMNQIEKQVNALGEAVRWHYDRNGRLERKEAGEQEVAYTSDKYGRKTSVDYGSGNEVKYTYDAWGRIREVKVSRGGEGPAFEAVAKYSYNALNRLVEMELDRKTEKHILKYGWTPSGRKSWVEWKSRTADGEQAGRTDYEYDKAGQLAEIRSDGKTVVQYSYDNAGRLSGKVMKDGTRMSYRHDDLDRIVGMTVKTAGGKALADIRYTWDVASRLVSREWDGKIQRYGYDAMGQLTVVKTDGTPGETYQYDLAGNMVEKKIGGARTVMAYDAANRLTGLARPDGKTIKYEYDSASRLAREILGEETTEYRYGLFEKVNTVLKPGERRADYAYWPDGQMAEKESSRLDAHTSKIPNSETYLWDGLALLVRGEEKFAIEPHISGGVPIMTSDKESSSVLISDFLGTTLGMVKGEEFIPTPLTAFGESMTTDSSSPALSKQERVEGFFTGKPYDPDLKAYVFLFRNYRPELGRWTATDPAGFPDGGNNMLYVLNSPLIYLDDTGLTRLVNNSSYPVYVKDATTTLIITVNPGQTIGTQGADDGFDGFYNPLDDPNKPGSPATFINTDTSDAVRKFNDWADITITDAGFDSEGRPLIDWGHNNRRSRFADWLDRLVRRYENGPGWKDPAWIERKSWPAQPWE